MMVNVYLTHAGHKHMVLNHHPHSHVVSHDRPKATSHPQREPWAEVRNHDVWLVKSCGYAALIIAALEYFV